jgi:hypothetical protein
MLLQVTQALAEALGMPPAQGGTLLRLTQHNQYTHAPQRQPLRNRQTATLQSMLAGAALFNGTRRAFVLALFRLYVHNQNH